MPILLLVEMSILNVSVIQFSSTYLDFIAIVRHGENPGIIVCDHETESLESEGCFVLCGYAGAAPCGMEY